MDKPTYNDLRGLIREKAHAIIDLLRDVKRIHTMIESSVTSEDLLRSRVTVPDGYRFDNDYKLLDERGNIVADYSKEKYECDLLISAWVGLRAIVAILEDDKQFLQRPGVLNVKHISFIERFMDWNKRGGL